MMLQEPIHHFLFQSIPVRPFRRMLAAWAFVTLGTLLMQWRDVAVFYSGQGFLPVHPDMLSLTVFPRFSLLHFVTDPAAVFGLYLVLLLLLLCVGFGFGKRFFLVMSIALLHSFHHRNPLPMGGGDVLLFNIGFLLMVASLFSEKRSQFPHAASSESSTTFHSHVMPIWPYRLLLFQIIVLYLSSLWWKLLGETWIGGTAVAIALHNPEFIRFALPAGFIHAFSFTIGYLTMLWEALWILLLVPHWKHHEQILRFLLLTGVLFHLGILLLLKVGSFSMAILVAYLGLWRGTATKATS